MKEAPLVDLPECPIPAGGEAVFLKAEDGTVLRCARWRGNGRGTVVLFNGRTEFIEKYFETIRLLLERGFAVATLDWRGQGLSGRMLADRRKGHIDSFCQFDKDVDLFLSTFVCPELPGPYIGLGHSMGGNILMRLLSRCVTGQTDFVFAGIVLSAPMLGIRFPNALIRLCIRLYARVFCRLGLGKQYIPGGRNIKTTDEEAFEDNKLTHDRARYQRHQRFLRARPELALGGLSIGWLGAAFRSCRDVMQPSFLRSVDVPVLLASAQEEALVDNAAIAKVAALLPRGQEIRIPHAKHEILMEYPCAQDFFWSGFDAWTEKIQARL